MTALETGFSRKNFRQDSLLSCDADTAMLTHDIRTALNGVIGGMALIDVVSLPAEAAMQVERARAASRVLVSLIEQVIGHDESVDDFDPLHDYVDLHEYRNFLVNRWEGEARARGASLEVVVGNDVPAALDRPFTDDRKSHFQCASTRGSGGSEGADFTVCSRRTRLLRA